MSTRPAPTLHRTIIGRSREVRGPDAFERGVAAIIIAAVAVLAVGFGLQLSRMAQTLEAVSLVATAKIDAITYHTIHGRWPRAGDRNLIPPDGASGRYVQRLALGGDGAITATMALGPLQGIPSANADAPVADMLHGALTFRPELLGAHDAPTVSYLCGYAKPTAGALQVDGRNLTTLPRQVLPPFCR